VVGKDANKVTAVIKKQRSI